MEESSNIVKEGKKKPSRKKYIIAAGIIFLCILVGLIYGAGLIYWAKTWTPTDSESQKKSEAIIRKAAVFTYARDHNNEAFIEQVKRLNKSYWMDLVANSLTNEDFGTITFLRISDKELSDIKFLEKFSNLHSLTLIHVTVPEKKIPLPMKTFAKLRVFNLETYFALDLSPLKKLTNLQRIDLVNTQVSNLESLKGLKNLKRLNIRNCPNITDEQVEELQKALPNLEIER